MRRIWECPACQRREWTKGDVVNLRCPICRARKDMPADVWMALIDPPRKPRPLPPGLSPVTTEPPAAAGE